MVLEVVERGDAMYAKTILDWLKQPYTNPQEGYPAMMIQPNISRSLYTNLDNFVGPLLSLAESNSLKVKFNCLAVSHLNVDRREVL